jgi:hypothetical protein
LQLDFSADTFTFEATGVLKNIEDFGTATTAEENDSRDYKDIFKIDEAELQHVEIVKRAIEKWGIGVATAKRDIRKKLVKNERGKYDNVWQKAQMFEQAVLEDLGLPAIPEPVSPPTIIPINPIAVENLESDPNKDDDNQIDWL